MRRLLGRWVRRTGAFFWLSLVCALLGTIYLTGLLSSTAGLLWTGQAVHATETDGLIVYSYNGKSFTIDDTGSYRTGPLTVYVDTGNPKNATVDRMVPRISEAFFVVAPYTASVAFGIFGLVRWRRRRLELAEGKTRGVHGFGFDEGELVRAFPDRLRAQPGEPPQAQRFD